MSTDQHGQDQFKPVANRRAGYGDQLDWALKMARKGGCLGAGEGLLLVEHFEERLAEAENAIKVIEHTAHHAAERMGKAERERDAEIARVVRLTERLGTALHELDRANAILAALREPGEAVVEAMRMHIYSYGLTEMRDVNDGLRAAVAAAEQEVSDDAR